MNTLKEKFWGKYGLYLLCFFALNGIEFLCATQPGNIWKPAANCTGFVMMVIIFSQISIKQFLKPITYIYTLVCLLSIGAVYLHWRQHISTYSFGQAATGIMNAWWLGLVLYYWFRKIFEQKERHLRFGALGWSWILLTLWTIISIAGRWWPLWYLLMFGAFYLIRFSKEDKAALVNAMIDGTIASFFVIQSYAYLFRPYDIVRYSGAFSNTNMMALYYLIIYCMILFKLHLLHVNRAKWGWKLFYMIGAGGLLGFQFLTICRTAWICSIVITLCYGLVVLRKAWGESFPKLILRGCVLVLTAVITFPAVFLTVRWIPTIHPHPIWHEGEWSPNRVASWDPATSEKYVGLDEFLEEALGRVIYMLQIIDARNPLTLKVHAQTVNPEHILPEPSEENWYENSLTIRKVIFRTYWENATWLGHPEEDGHYTFEESGLYIWHGQNLWIQFVYYFGYPAGILLALLIIFTLWKVIRKSTTIKEDSFAMIPLIICLTFFLFGLMEVVWMPGQLILTLVFLVMHPQLTEKEAL